MHPVPAAKDAIKALLAADAAFDDLDVQDGRPGKIEKLRKNAFWFEPTIIPKDGWEALGASRRRVTFTLNFVIATRRHGDHEREAEDAAWDYFEAFMALVKANPGLSGSVKQTGDVTGRQENGPSGTDQWQTVIVVSLTCTSNFY